MVAMVGALGGGLGLARVVATLPAASRHGEVVGVDLEAVSRLCRSGQAVEDLRGYFDADTALFADEVTVGAGGEVVGGRAVGEMGVDDDAQLFELIEVAVNGGEVGVGGLGLDLGGQLFGGPVPGLIDEGLEQEAARAGHSPAAGPEEGHHVVNGRDCAGDVGPIRGFAHARRLTVSPRIGRASDTKAILVPSRLTGTTGFRL